MLPESELTTDGAAGGLDVASHEMTCCCPSDVMASRGSEADVKPPAVVVDATAPSDVNAGGTMATESIS